MEGREVKALMDSGCSKSVVLASLVSTQLKRTSEVMIANGTKVSCYCDIVVNLLVRGMALQVRCLALQKPTKGYRDDNWYGYYWKPRRRTDYEG